VCVLEYFFRLLETAYYVVTWFGNDIARNMAIVQLETNRHSENRLLLTFCGSRHLQVSFSVTAGQVECLFRQTQESYKPNR
jgi:hypothetical protein